MKIEGINEEKFHISFREFFKKTKPMPPGRTLDIQQAAERAKGNGSFDSRWKLQILGATGKCVISSETEA